jgi:hypothetical protein
VETTLAILFILSIILIFSLGTQLSEARNTIKNLLEENSKLMNKINEFKKDNDFFSNL